MCICMLKSRSLLARVTSSLRRLHKLNRHAAHALQTSPSLSQGVSGQSSTHPENVTLSHNCLWNSFTATKGSIFYTLLLHCLDFTSTWYWLQYFGDPGTNCKPPNDDKENTTLKKTKKESHNLGQITTNGDATKIASRQNTNLYSMKASDTHQCWYEKFRTQTVSVSSSATARPSVADVKLLQGGTVGMCLSFNFVNV